VKIELITKYKSLKQLESPDLPSFTVLTGLNGSGKTQLLEAIVQRHITIDGVQNGKNSTEYRLYSFSNLTPNNSQGVVGMSSLGTQRVQFWAQYLSLRSAAWASYKGNTLFGEVDVHLFPANLRELGPRDPQVVDYLLAHQQTVDVMEPLVVHMNQYFRPSNKGGSVDPGLFARLAEIATKAGQELHSLTDADFFLYGEIAPPVQQVFQQSFNHLFANYQAARVENSFREYQHQTARAQKAFLSADEFQRRFGPPPWETMNRIFETARLNIRVVAPPDDLYANYDARLIEQSTKELINFSDLSSGEKIIASFALCLYYAEDRRQSVDYPKVLLFDEVDATLHPSMTQSLLSIIQNVLVDQEKISVVLTTHSPTTVALAPSESLYVIKKSIGTRIEKVGKDAALSVLTGDIPTLSIDYENRRQIFVESAYDANVYDIIYRCLKSKIQSPRSLCFIEVDPAHNIDGGCDRLKATVKKLRDGGNRKICGVVDHDDGRHGFIDGIYSMPGRYSIENWSLDPLLLGAFLIKTKIVDPKALGLPEGSTYLSLSDLDPNLRQLFAERTWSKFKFDGNHGLISQPYVGGFAINIPSVFCTIDGHRLEAQILENEPKLQGVTKQKGPLYPHVIHWIATDLPWMIPMAFKHLFDAILVS
jgi:predicted ATPase